MARDQILDVEAPQDEESTFILKIPEFCRSSGKHYTPVEWRFGLHNREKSYTGETEAVKLRAAAAFGLQMQGPKWDEFCQYVVDDPVSLLKSYGLPRDHMSNSEVKRVLALDPLFLVLLFDYQSLQKFTNHALQSLFFSRRTYPILDLLSVGDLALVENQIPMALLRKVVKWCIHYADGKSDHEELILDKILKKAVFYAWPLTDKLLAHKESKDEKVYPLDEYLELTYPLGRLSTCEHILDCVYNIICGPKGVKEVSGNYNIGDYIHVESATNLNAYGVKIQPVSGTLENIAFQKGCLYLPVIMVGDKTGSMLRNIALYERFYKSPACIFEDYLQLMLDLIGGPNDVKLLAKCGVLSRDLDAKEFEEWNSLGEGLIMPAPSKYFHEMKASIVKHCKSKKNVIWAEFNLLFCSRPWYVISVITVTIVTIATLIQTYISVISSDHMRPHFSGH